MNKRLAVLGVILPMAVGWWLLQRGEKQVVKAESRMPMAAAKAMEEEAKLRGSEALPGTEILKHYGEPGVRPEEDLQAVAHAFSNLMLLVKSDAPFRLGANEEFAAALMGKNATKTVFLAPPHACLNEQGQLIDRWDTPLFFHVSDATRIDIRSAGPDREMWTEDDLHRRHDGEFLRGASLPEPKRK